MLKKEEEKERERERKNKTNKNKQSRINYKENTGTKLITNTKKDKLRIYSRVWNFRYTMLFKRRRERNREKEKEKIKKGHRNYKKKNTHTQKTIGTKLITNTQKLKLKIQSRVWNFKNTMLKKRKKKKGQKIIKNIYMKFTEEKKGLFFLQSNRL